MTRLSPFRTSAVAGIALATAIALAACGSSTTTGNGSGGSSGGAGSTTSATQELKVGVPDAVTNLLPGIEAGSVNYWIAAIEAEGLVTLGSDGSLQPALATSWTQPNPTTYVYQLNPNRKFQNGAPVKPADILASINALRDPKIDPSESYLWSAVSTVKQTGPEEITITLSQPSASFKYTPSSSAGLWVYPASYWKNAGKNLGTPDDLPIGTGPYQVTSFSPSSSVTLTKSPYWTGPAPQFSSVSIQTFSEANAEKQALDAGQINMALPIPVSQYPTWVNDSKIATFFTPNRSLISLDFNTAVKPFNDQHVRNAIAYAFDRQAFVTKVLDGKAQAATSLLTPQQFSAVSSAEDATATLAALPQYNFNLAQAKQELSESSVPNGFSVSVQVPSAYSELQTAALLLQQNLAPLGIKVNITTGTTDAWFATMGDTTHGLGLMSYTTVSADPGEISNWFLSSDTKPGDGTNPANLQDPAITAAMTKAQAATTTQAYLDDLVAANTISNQKNYYLPISWGQLAIATNGVTLTNFTSYTMTSPWILQVSPTN